MKKLALAAAAVSILFTGAASAADPPTTYTKAPPPQILSWAGFYAGINAGGNWGTSSESLDVTSRGGFFGPPCFPPANVCGVNVVDVRNAGLQKLNTSGFTGGGQVGYNWQTGATVFGVEADLNYFRGAGNGSRTVGLGLVLGVPETVTVGESMSTDWLFTLRPRIGWAINNNWLLYATGGLAVTNLKAGWTFRETVFGNVAAGSASGTKAGWTVGAGVETKFSGGWGLGLEYLYVRFDNISGTVPVVLPAGGGPVAQNFTENADLQSNIVRAKLNYHF